MLDRRSLLVGTACTLAVLPAFPTLVSANSPVNPAAKIGLIMEGFAGADSDLFFAGLVGPTQEIMVGSIADRWLSITLPSHMKENADHQHAIQSSPLPGVQPTFTVMAWDDDARTWATYDPCILAGHEIVPGEKVSNGEEALRLTILYGKRTIADRPPTGHWVRELQQHHRLVA